MRPQTPSKPYTEHLLRPGNTNCAGCGMSVGLQFLDEALGDDQPVMVIPSSCGIVTAGMFPTSGYGVPTAATTFASSPAVATGISAVTEMNDIDNPVICWAGDGGTYDIGMATLSAAAERNEDIIYICYDNEIYGNTGGQRSSATPVGSVTSTTKSGKAEYKKNIMAIMAAHRVPYAATLSIGHRKDFLRKVQYARSVKGFRFLLMLSPCPTGWKSEPAEGIELVRWAVASGLYPVYEVEADGRVAINLEPDMSDDALQRYFAAQGRFRKGQVDLGTIRASIDASWEALRCRASEGERDDREA